MTMAENFERAKGRSVAIVREIEMNGKNIFD